MTPVGWLTRIISPGSRMGLEVLIQRMIFGVKSKLRRFRKVTSANV
jgi:hypothetical protein